MDREKLRKDAQEAWESVASRMSDERLAAFLATSEGPDGPEPPPGFIFKPLPPGVFDPDETERRILGLPDIPAREQE
jgi:hypothetical protein